MLRIFVTGDNHIGLKYVNHEKKDILIEERINAFRGMVNAANEEKCGLFIITGDLFENLNRIPQKQIKAVLEILKDFDGTVAILPGNHDYYDENSDLWQNCNKLSANCDNILLLSEYKPYNVAVAEDIRAILYPALCTSRNSRPDQNNLGQIKTQIVKDDSAYHIGIAHGAVEGETIDNEGQYFLMKRSELEEIPVDVWLIGHTHVPFPKNLTDDFAPCDKILNPGTHVQTDVSCNTEGLCFIVAIDENKQVTAKKYVSGGIRFFRKEIALSAGEAETVLEKELDRIPNRSVVDIILSGAVTADEYDILDQMLQDKLSRFIEGTYNAHKVSRLISEELIRSEFAETSLAASLLENLLVNPKEAQLAYELLKSLREEK